MNKKKIILASSVAAAAIVLASVVWPSVQSLNLMADQVNTSNRSVTVDFKAADFTAASGSIVKHGVTFDYSGISVSGSTITVSKDGYIVSHEQTNAIAGSGAHGMAYVGFAVYGVTVTITNSTTATSGYGILDYGGDYGSLKTKTWYKMFTEYGSQRFDSQITSLVAGATGVTVSNQDLNCLGYKDNGDGNDRWVEGGYFRVKANDIAFTCTGMAAEWACYADNNDYVRLYSTFQNGVYSVTAADGTDLPYAVAKGAAYSFKVVPTTAYSKRVFTVKYGYGQKSTPNTLTAASGVYTIPASAVTGDLFINVTYTTYDQIATTVHQIWIQNTEGIVNARIHFWLDTSDWNTDAATAVNLSDLGSNLASNVLFGTTKDVFSQMYQVKSQGGNTCSFLAYGTNKDAATWEAMTLTVKAGAQFPAYSYFHDTTTTPTYYVPTADKTFTYSSTDGNGCLVFTAA